MFAIIRTGNKQYKVKAGDLLRVEKLNAKAGETIEISDVLLLADDKKATIGTPQVVGAKVSAKINGHGRGPKIEVIKFLRRKNHRKQMGHRQTYTELLITDVVTNNAEDPIKDGT